MIIDFPNTFFQTNILRKDKDINVKEKIKMKILGVLLYMLLELYLRVHEYFVIYERNYKVLYMEKLKALHGMLLLSILFCEKFIKDIEGIGFEVNPCNICVANRIINNK